MRQRVKGKADVVAFAGGAPRGRYVGPDGQCAMERVLDVIANKWSVPLLFVLSQSPEPVRFKALQRAVGKVTQKELTRHVRELERVGLVSRTVFPEVPPRVEYGLTPLGRTFVPAIQSLAIWGEEHAHELDAHAAAFDGDARVPDVVTGG